MVGDRIGRRPVLVASTPFWMVGIEAFAGGERLTRGGAFRLDDQRRIVTANGDLLTLSFSGQAGEGSFQGTLSARVRNGEVAGSVGDSRSRA